MLTRVGTMAMPCFANDVTVPSSRPHACSTQSVPAAARSRRDCSPKQCAVTRAPSSCAAATACASTSAGQHGDEVAGVAVDPVPDELDPPVTRASLHPDLVDELVRFDLPRVVADVPVGPGDVSPRTDQARQVLALLDPAGVRRRTRVAQQQGAGRLGRRAPAPRPWRRRSRRVRPARCGCGRPRAREAPSRARS